MCWLVKGWRDGLEVGVRGRIRGFMEELLDEELTAALSPHQSPSCGAVGQKRLAVPLLVLPAPAATRVHGTDTIIAPNVPIACRSRWPLRCPTTGSASPRIRFSSHRCALPPAANAPSNPPVMARPPEPARVRAGQIAAASRRSAAPSPCSTDRGRSTPPSRPTSCHALALARNLRRQHGGALADVLGLLRCRIGPSS